MGKISTQKSGSPSKLYFPFAKNGSFDSPVWRLEKKHTKPFQTKTPYNRKTIKTDFLTIFANVEH